MTNLLKKSIALILCLCMVLTVAACETPNNSSESSQSSQESSSSGVGGETTGEASYTFSDYVAGSPATWNPHTWETSDDSYILGYNTMGLYDYQLNATMDGYEIVPEMAAEMPEDVTALYADQFDFIQNAEEQSQYAWRVKLNEAATWDDGTPINADTYIYSMQQQLNPYMLNRRADSYYAGYLAINNAKNYLYSAGRYYDQFQSYGDEYLVEDETGYMTTPNGDYIVLSMLDAVYFFTEYSMYDYYTLGYASRFQEFDGEGNVTVDHFANLWNNGVCHEENEGYFYMTEDMIPVLTIIAQNFGDENPTAWKEFCVAYVESEATWEDVGLYKIDDYTIDIVSTIRCDEFYFCMSMSSNWIVKEDLYEACKQQSGEFITSTYCTSLETTANFGPYKLTEYQLDKGYTLEKNDAWYGWTDGKHEGQFQTTKISVQVIESNETALQMFLAGQLDYIGLDSDSVADYRNSDYILYTPQTYTSKLVFNTDYDKLAARELSSTAGGAEDGSINKTILTLTSFRKALSLCINRSEFCASFTASHVAGFGLLNYMYCADYLTGETYRDSVYAKMALLNVYGVEYDPNDEDSINDAYDSMTGYDVIEATALFQEAYDEAVELGYINSNFAKVNIEFMVYNSDEAYTKMVNYMNECIATATVGTPLEGKVEIYTTVNPDYYDSMAAGDVDVIWGTWGGAAFGTYSMMFQCYCDDAYGAGNQMEYGFDTSKIELTIEYNGVEYTNSVRDWAYWMYDTSVAIDDLGVFSNYSTEDKCYFFAAVEECYLSYYVNIPMYYRTSASLFSQKGQYATTTYLQIVGYGGIRHFTYNYTDAEWAQYIEGGISYV